MGKLADLRAAAGAVARESLGVRRPATPGDAPAPPAPRAGDRMKGLARPKETVAEIPLERIVPDPDQPRKEFDSEALERLAESLRAHGQQQPIRVRWSEERGVYLVLLGERRYRAAKLGGLPSLSCVIHEGPLAPAERLALQLVENLLRTDLAPLEEAQGYHDLQAQTGESARQIAERLSLSPSRVTRSLALLTLPESVRTLIAGGLPASTAYALTGLDDAQAQAELATAAVEHRWSRDEVEHRVREIRSQQEAAAAAESAGPVPAAGPVEPSADVVAPGPADPPVRHRDAREAQKHIPVPSTPITADGAARPAAGARTGPPAAGPRIGQDTAGEPGTIAGTGEEVARGDGRPRWPASAGPYERFEVATGPRGVGALVDVTRATWGPTIVEALDLALAEARRRWGPASYWEIGTRVRIESDGHVNHGRRGTICPRRPRDPDNPLNVAYDPTARSPGTAWVCLDGTEQPVPYDERIIAREEAP